jgi:hypothetical protein
MRNTSKRCEVNSRQEEFDDLNACLLLTLKKESGR